MFSSFRSRKEARRYAIAWLLSAAFIFVAEHSYEIRLYVFGWHVRIYDPFFLYSISIAGHSLAAYCFAINVVPFLIMSCIVAVKAFAEYKFRIVNLVASLVFDWSLTCVCFAFRDPSKFDETEANIVFISIGIFLVQLLLYKYRRRMIPFILYFHLRR